MTGIDETVSVAVISDGYFGWLQTPEGQAALQLAIEARGIVAGITASGSPPGGNLRLLTGELPGDDGPTMAIPRPVADEARELAIRRRDEQIDGAPPDSL